MQNNKGCLLRHPFFLVSLLIEICKQKTILSKSWLFLFPHRSTFNKNFIGINGHSYLSLSFLSEFCGLTIFLLITWQNLGLKSFALIETQEKTLSVDMQLSGRPGWGSTPNRIGGSFMCQGTRWRLPNNIVRSMLFQKSTGSMFVQFSYWPALS